MTWGENPEFLSSLLSSGLLDGGGEPPQVPLWARETWNAFWELSKRDRPWLTVSKGLGGLGDRMVARPLYLSNQSIREYAIFLGLDEEAGYTFQAIIKNLDEEWMLIAGEKLS